MISSITHYLPAISTCQAFVTQRPFIAAAGGLFVAACVFSAAKKIASFALGFFCGAVLTFKAAMKTQSIHQLGQEQILSLSLLSGFFFGLSVIRA